MRTLQTNLFRMKIQNTFLQKSYELTIGAQSVEFNAANRQFDWLELSLVYEKNNQRETTYDSCSA